MKELEEAKIKVLDAVATWHKSVTGEDSRVDCVRALSAISTSIDSLVSLAKQEQAEECDTECRKVADQFYREALSKDPEERFKSRYQHDGASACVQAIRAKAGQSSPVKESGECPMCKGEGRVIDPWGDEPDDMCKCYRCKGTGKVGSNDA